MHSATTELTEAAADRSVGKAHGMRQNNSASGRSRHHLHRWLVIHKVEDSEKRHARFCPAISSHTNGSKNCSNVHPIGRGRIGVVTPAVLSDINIGSAAL